MIISEKQINALLFRVQQYITTLQLMDQTNGLGLSETGKENLKESMILVNAINNQQSEELKEIE